MTEVKSGYLIYKCRRCGYETKEFEEDAEELAIIILRNATSIPNDSRYVARNGRTSTQLNRRHLTAHKCNENSIGVLDLIGVDFDTQSDKYASETW